MATVPRRVAFRDAEFAPYRGSGSGMVTGQLVVVDSDGKIRVGEGAHITILPVTSYTREMVERVIGDGDNLADSDPRLKEFVRLKTTDDNGNFVFDHVRSGQYFVSGLVEWGDADNTEYQWACERVTVGNGQTVHLKVSQNLHHPDKPTMVLWALE